VRCVSPRELPTLEPEVCLATSFDYEDQIAARARGVLPDTVEVLTLTQLIYEYDVEVRPWTETQLLPIGHPKPSDGRDACTRTRVPTADA